MAAVGRWSCDKWQQSSAGAITTRVLSALDALDRHSFEKVDANNSLDTLYAKIFNPPTSKEASKSTSSSNAVVPQHNGGAHETREDQMEYVCVILFHYYHLFFMLYFTSFFFFSVFRPFNKTNP